MTTLLWTLGILAYTALVFAVGAAAAFVYYARGRWEVYATKMMPPRIEFIEAILNELVYEGKFSSADARLLTNRLWTVELKKRRMEAFERQQEAVGFSDQRDAERERRDEIRSALEAV